MNRFCLSLGVLNVFGALVLAPPAAGEPETTREQPAPIGKRVDLGGYHLHLIATGAGKPAVVLIAGAGDFALDWTLTQRGVASFASVCSYDRAGLGWSDLGPVPRTMKQEAYELRLTLQKAGFNPPYVLVGHSLGGLVARVYAADYPADVAGMVLVDSTHEDTTLIYQGKLVRVRDRAQGRPIPQAQTLQTSPPRPPTEEDRKQAEFNAQMFGPPKIKPPFDQLPPEIQRLRLWMLAHPKLAASAEDYWPDELQALYAAREATDYPLGERPLVVLVPADRPGEPPPGIDAEEWVRFNAVKRMQKEALVHLSRNSLLLVAEKSGHHIQLDQPELVIKAIRRVVDASRNNSKLSDTQ